jgi:hypothetical protein
MGREREREMERDRERENMTMKFTSYKFGHVKLEILLHTW